MKDNRICFNIWDDYEDNKQDTYGYVEHDQMDEDQKREVSAQVFEYVLRNIPDLKVKMNGSDVEFFGLSHRRREILVDELQKSGIKYNGSTINFYSES